MDSLPVMNLKTPLDVARWFSALDKSGLLWHMDDNPAECLADRLDAYQLTILENLWAHHLEAAAAPFDPFDLYPWTEYQSNPDSVYGARFPILSDIAEEQQILLESGEDSENLHGFDFEGSYIVNPFMDPSARALVDPPSYYGSLFTVWAAEVWTAYEAGEIATGKHWKVGDKFRMQFEQRWRDSNGQSVRQIETAICEVYAVLGEQISFSQVHIESVENPAPGYQAILTCGGFRALSADRLNIEKL